MPTLDQDMAAFVQIKNEDYWIELILRVLCGTFSEVLVMLNGCQDQTPKILNALKSEGLHFHVVEYDEPWTDREGRLSQESCANAIKNTVIKEHIRSRWLYVVDGDEIQYEETCKRVAEVSRHNNNCVRGMVHFQFNNPRDFFSLTKKFCPRVRYRGGRIFDLQSTRWKEPGYDEFEWRPEYMAEPVESIYSEKKSIFLPEAIVLHAALHQRSTLSSWSGANDGAFRKNYFSNEATDYAPLTLFPKESLQCRYSDHNHLLRAVRSLPNIDYI